MIGVMQGRLVPPIDNRIQCFPEKDWKLEFGRAKKLRLSCIEWTYDEIENPIDSDTGIEEIKNQILKTGVQVPSICADYFMQVPEVDVVIKLLSRSSKLGISHIVVPFVDNSAIDIKIDFDSATKMVLEMLLEAEKFNVGVNLETNLSPLRFQEFLMRIPHYLLGVNYDSGNSAALGYLPREEFSAYGTRIKNFHIKDRIFGNGTVPLGAGNADFYTLSKCLKEINYSENFILQVARGVENDEVNWARNNKKFAERNIING